MSDIAEKLLAAITAKEDKAREATEGPWTLYDRGVGWEINELPDVHDGTTFTKPDAEFIADNDPDDVLRHCAADREIVAEVMSWKHFYDGNDEWYSCGLAVDPSGFGGTEPGSGCANDDDRGRCTCSLEARQLRILEPLARGYEVTRPGEAP